MTLILSPKLASEVKPSLQVAELSLPDPESLPEQHRLLSHAELLVLLKDAHPLVRGYAVEQIGLRLPDPELAAALCEHLADPDPAVASQSIEFVGQSPDAAALDAMAELMKTAEGEPAAQLARVLADHQVDRLLEAIAARGRLSDQVYGAVMSALALNPTEAVIALFDRALTRAAILPPERRGALFGAALLTGHERLCARVFHHALTESRAPSDSEKPDENEAIQPARAAIATAAALPIQASLYRFGRDLLKDVENGINAEILSDFAPDAQAAIEEAFRIPSIKHILLALEPALSLPGIAIDEIEASTQRMIARRRGLARFLIDHAEAIGTLSLDAAPLFVAALSQSLAILLGTTLPEATGTAMRVLAGIFEDTSAEALSEASRADLAARFSAISPRQMRRVIRILIQEPFRRIATSQRFVEALLDAGAGRELLENLAETAAPETGLQNLLFPFVKHPKAEALVVELLGEPDLPEPLLRLALELANLIRSERISVTLAKRFYALRARMRPEFLQAVLRTGDTRFLPLLESRLYPDEPEELSYALLKVIEGGPLEGDAFKRLDRVPDPALLLWLPLRCPHCEEQLSYGFYRVFIDAEDKTRQGDPAFVGNTRCKACGAENSLEMTALASQILTQHMLTYLEAAKRGEAVGPPLVAPAQTQVDGKKMGFAEALRQLDARVDSQPDHLDLRMHRAQLRMQLRRPEVETDLAVLREADPNAPQLIALELLQRLQNQAFPEAAELAIAGLKRIDAGEPARMYSGETPAQLKAHFEDHLLMLQRLGIALPEAVDLSAAEARHPEAEAHEHGEDCGENCTHEHGA